MTVSKFNCSSCFKMTSTTLESYYCKGTAALKSVFFFFFFVLKLHARLSDLCFYSVILIDEQETYLICLQVKDSYT